MTATAEILATETNNLEASMRFILTEQEWEEFNAVLDREYNPEDFPKMRKLLTSESPFAKEDECTTQ